MVLTVGFLPNTDVFSLYKGEALAADDFGYVREIDPVSEPTRTNVDGLFAAGTTIGVMDIPDTVLHSGAAASPGSGLSGTNEGRAMTDKRRIGVYVCHCGGNISDHVNVKEVADDALEAKRKSRSRGRICSPARMLRNRR